MRRERNGKEWQQRKLEEQRRRLKKKRRLGSRSITDAMGNQWWGLQENNTKGRVKRWVCPTLWLKSAFVLVLLAVCARDLVVIAALSWIWGSRQIMTHTHTHAHKSQFSCPKKCSTDKHITNTYVGDIAMTWPRFTLKTSFCLLLQFWACCPHMHGLFFRFA